MSSGASSSRSMESRVGRQKQRYAENGDRLVAGIVPTTADKEYVLLIQSTSRNAWVLPKGGWETDEECIPAAHREAWEEAGIECEIDFDLGDLRVAGGEKQNALYRLYEATVTKQHDKWPEMATRNREWFTFAEASKALASRPELLEYLKRSTLKR